MSNKLTLADIFDEDKIDAPDNWDISWITEIKIPENLALNMAQATKLMTQTARAVEWCGEKIALLLYLSDKAKTDVEKEWSEAFLLRSKDKTAAGRKVEAEADPEYLLKKAKHTRFKSFLEYFRQKQNGFLNTHNAMKEIIRSNRNELPVAGWGTTDNAYNENNKTESQEEPPEQEDNFDLD